MCCGVLCAQAALWGQNAPAPADATPVMSPHGGVFASNVTVTLASAATEVRFTLDGSVPTTNSPRYAAPLQISNSCVLHARAFGRPGTLAAETYTLLETNLLEFNSTLPLVLIQTFGHAIQPETNLMASVRFIDLGASNRSSLRGDENFDGRAGVKTRGYSSRRYPKRSLALETRTPAGESQHVPLLGFPKDSDWVLYAPYPDKTMLRDVLAYELSNQMGHYASRTRYVEVFLNETTNRLSREHYVGIYVLEEKVKRGEKRVRIDKLGADDNAEPEISGGYIFKKDHIDEVERLESPTNAIAALVPALPRGVAGRLGYPSGPGGFPADPAGFLPAFDGQVTVTNVTYTTNVATVTNVVSDTRLDTRLAVATFTNLITVTNVASVTNRSPVTNVVVRQSVLLATNVVSITNIAPVTNIVSLTNPAPFNGVVTFTNVAGFTNFASFTNSAPVTNQIAVTNILMATNIAAITNISAFSAVASITNTITATNLVVTTSLGLATNIASFTNIYVTNLTSVLLAAYVSSGSTGYLARLVQSGQGFVTSRTNAFYFVEPKVQRITPAQRAWLSNYVNQFEQALYGPDFRNPTNGYRGFIDAESFIDHHLIVEATKNIDGFRFSTFFSKDRGGKIRMEPIWDWNLSLGNARGKQGDLTEHWYWPQLDDQQYSWFRRLFEDPDFAQRYVDRWAELRTNIFATSNLLARVDDLVAFLKEPAARNFERWPILGVSINPERFVGKNYDEEIQYLKGWMTNRLAWVSAQFLPPPIISSSDGAVPAGRALVLSGAGGKIYFTLDGSDPRAPGGGVAPTAKAFEQPLPITADVAVTARLFKDNRWSSPARARLAVKGQAQASGG